MFEVTAKQQKKGDNLKRILKMLGLALVVTAILVVFITGAVAAAGDNAEAAQNKYEECPYDEPYGDCVPNLWGEPGPHGQANGG